MELGAGDFKLSRGPGDETIVIKSGVTLRGQGYATHIYLDPATPPQAARYYPVRIGSESTPASNVVIENLRYTGNNAKIGGGSIMGFNARLGAPAALLLSCDNVTIRNCWIYDAQQAAGCTKPGGTHYVEPERLASQFKNWRVCGNTIDTCGNKAIEFDETNGGLIADNDITNTFDGPQVICGSRNVQIRDNHVRFTNSGINITEGSHHIRVSGNHVEPVPTINPGTANGCLYIRTEPQPTMSVISDIVVTGNIFRDQTTRQKSLVKFNTRVESLGCTYRSMTLTGNVFDGNLELYDALTPAKTTIEDLVLADNVCEGDIVYAARHGDDIKTGDDSWKRPAPSRQRLQSQGQKLDLVGEHPHRRHARNCHRRGEQYRPEQHDDRTDHRPWHGYDPHGQCGQEGNQPKQMNFHWNRRNFLHTGCLGAASLLARVSRAEEIQKSKAEATSSAVEIGDRRQLFIDDALIDAGRTQNVVRRLNAPYQIQRVLKPEQPWEALGFVFYCGVVDDGGVAKLYYSGYDREKKKHSMLATSMDGLNWERPKLGLKAQDGNTANNLLLLNSVEATVFLDPHSPPEKRYRMVYTRGFPDPAKAGVCVASSADGIRWNEFPERCLPFIPDSQPSALWDERLGKYVVYLRAWDPIRTVARVEIADLETAWPYDSSVPPLHVWGKDKIPTLSRELPRVIAYDEQDQPYLQPYTSEVIQYPSAADVYFAFPADFQNFKGPDWKARALTGNDGTFDIGFATSRDGVTWNRWREPYIPIGLYGDLDLRLVSMGFGLLINGAGHGCTSISSAGPTRTGNPKSGSVTRPAANPGMTGIRAGSIARRSAWTASSPWTPRMPAARSLRDHSFSKVPDCISTCIPLAEAVRGWPCSTPKGRRCRVLPRRNAKSSRMTPSTMRSAGRMDRT